MALNDKKQNIGLIQCDDFDKMKKDIYEILKKENNIELTFRKDDILELSLILQRTEKPEWFSYGYVFSETPTQKSTPYRISIFPYRENYYYVQIQGQICIFNSLLENKYNFKDENKFDMSFKLPKKVTKDKILKLIDEYVSKLAITVCKDDKILKNIQKIGVKMCLNLCDDLIKNKLVINDASLPDCVNTKNEPSYITTTCESNKSLKNLDNNDKHEVEICDIYDPKYKYLYHIKKVKSDLRVLVSQIRNSVLMLNEDKLYKSYLEPDLELKNVTHIFAIIETIPLENLYLPIKIAIGELCHWLNEYDIKYLLNRIKLIN